MDPADDVSSVGSLLGHGIGHAQAGPAAVVIPGDDRACGAEVKHSIKGESAASVLAADHHAIGCSGMYTIWSTDRRIFLPKHCSADIGFDHNELASAGSCQEVISIGSLG